MKINRNTQIICNKCGHVIEIKNDIPMEDYLKVNKDWGYFSKKDGTTVSFNLCEKCFDVFLLEMKIPAEIKETTELL